VLGNKTFDYLASGLPMLYAGTGDTADLIIEAKAGIVVTPERDDELINAILWFKNNRTKAEAMGRNGYEFVTTHYNRHKLLERFEKVQLMVVGNSSSANGMMPGEK
jgi:glycosyltransferase involved in cell wall biosynthesis